MSYIKAGVATGDQVQEILDHPEDYPMIPPVSLEDRLERFIQFVQMILIDGFVEESEEKLKYSIKEKSFRLFLRGFKNKHKSSQWSRGALN